MEQTNDKSSRFSLTARSKGWPTKLYTRVTIMNIEKVIAAEANAMWDTGAEMCVISKTLADALQLDRVPGISARGLTGSADTSVSYAYVAFVAGGGIVTVKCAIVDEHIGGPDYSIIIGLDIIRQGSLAITGTDTGMTLSFTMPATDVVDFAASAVNKPVSVMPLSNGREKLKLYTGVEAIKIMTQAVPADRTIENPENF